MSAPTPQPVNDVPEKPRHQSVGHIVSACVEIRTLEEAHALATMLSNMCPDPESAAMGMSELMINSIEHGNLGISFDEKSALLSDGRWLKEIERRLASPEYRNRRTTVYFRADPDAFHFVVEDQGDGFDFDYFLRAEPIGVTESHGRGIYIAYRSCFTSLHYEDAGRRAVAVLARHGAT